MSRFKLFLLILVIAILIILFVQNREPIALKLLCPDTTQSCLYQTPQLPLAVWIGLFTLGGMMTNLLGQVFSRFSYSSSAKPKYTNNDLYPERKNWVDQDRESSQYSTNSTQVKNSNLQDQPKIELSSTNYEVPQEPKNVERSGSTYSYTYRQAESSPQDQPKNKQKTSVEFDRDPDTSQEKDDEEWI